MYIALVNHTELEKAAGLYYGNMKAMAVGDEIDLGQGYNYSAEIKRACDTMTEAMKAFEKAKDTLMRFAVMVAEEGVTK